MYLNAKNLGNIGSRPSVVFHAYYQHPNIMTDHIQDHYGKDRIVIEISYGAGIFSDTMFGVTVLRQRHDGKWRTSPLSRCFSGTWADAGELAMAYTRCLLGHYLPPGIRANLAVALRH